MHISVVFVLTLFFRQITADDNYWQLWNEFNRFLVSFKLSYISN